MFTGPAITDPPKPSRGNPWANSMDRARTNYVYRAIPQPNTPRTILKFFFSLQNAQRAEPNPTRPTDRSEPNQTTFSSSPSSTPRRTDPPELHPQTLAADGAAALLAAAPRGGHACAYSCTRFRSHSPIGLASCGRGGGARADRRAEGAPLQAGAHPRGPRQEGSPPAPPSPTSCIRYAVASVGLVLPCLSRIGGLGS